MARVEVLSRRPESAKTQPFAGREILFTGAGDGTGLFVSAGLAEMGAGIIAGMRPGKETLFPDKYSKVAEKIGMVHITPFIGDLTEEKQVHDAISSLLEWGTAPTDVVLAAAGGMEDGILLGLANDLIPLRRAKASPEEMRAAILRKKPQIQEQIANTIDQARAINLDANVNLLYRIKDLIGDGFFPKGMRVIFYSSTPSSFFGRDFDEKGNDRTPFFYTGVAQTKNEFERWMDEHYQEFAAAGMYSGILSMHGINGTRVVKFGRNFLMPAMPQEQRDLLESGFIEQQFAQDATAQMLTEDISLWQNGVRRIYLIGKNAYSELSPEDPEYIPLDFGISA